MWYSRSCLFVQILTVLLIHDIVFSKCDLLKTESPNRPVKSYTDGYQRKERQTSIDLSRMYLPPKIDAVASSGFGGQVYASNNVGDYINYGYGEVGLDQDTYGRGSTVDNYDTSTKASNTLNGVQTTLEPAYGISTTSRSEGSSFDQSTGYNILTSEAGNNFGQNVNVNSAYIDLSSPGTSNYGGSLGTKSTPANNNDATAQTESADGYRQKELLNTAQSQGTSQNSYNKLVAVGAFSQNTGTRELQYNPADTNQNKTNDYSNPNALKTSFQENNRNSGVQHIYDQRNNENFGSSAEDQQLSGNGYHIPNSSNQKPTTNFNPKFGELSSQISSSNGQFEQNPTNSYSNRKPTEINQIQIGSSSFASPQELNSIEGGKELQSGTTSLNLYGQSWSSSNHETGLNPNSQSPLQKFNEHVVQNGKNYGQNVPASNELYNNHQGSSSQSRLNRGKQNLQLQSSSNYDQLQTLQSHAIRGNCIQSLSANSPVNGKCNQGGQTNIFAGQSRLFAGNPQLLNSYGPQTEYQPSSSAETGNYGQSGSVPSTSGAGVPTYTHGSAYSITGGSRSHNDVGEQNPLNRGNSIQHENNQLSTTSTSALRPDTNRYAQTHQNQNSLPTTTIIGVQRAAGQGPSSAGSNYGHRRIGSCASLCSKIIGRNSLANSAAGVGSDRSLKKHSTLVPRNQYQNSNLPGQGRPDLEKRGKYDDDNAGNGYGEENEFSNYGPGNSPDLRPRFGNGDDQPVSSNSYSNFSPNNSPSRPSTDNNNYDQLLPGSNSFSNFAPDSQPNRPPPVHPATAAVGSSLRSNDCDKSGGAIVNKQTEAIFSNNAGY